MMIPEYPVMQLSLGEQAVELDDCADVEDMEDTTGSCVVNRYIAYGGGTHNIKHTAMDGSVAWSRQLSDHLGRMSREVIK